MKSDRSVLLLEFNELSPPLMERWIDEGKLPNFQRLRDESQVYVTETEERPPNLEPWIQWVNVHSGLSYDQHKIYHLGDGPKLVNPCLWDILSDAKYRVWICGSMNARYTAPLNGAMLPDPWAKDLAPYPDTLYPYFHFVRQHVMEYTNDRVPLRPVDYLKFLAFMAGHGLSAETVRAVATQLISERTGGRRWKRAVILDKLQFDLFAWYYRKIQPHFATFFLNSTAHFQHMYWRNMEPRLFKVQPSTVEQAEYDKAILFGYQEMDRLVGRFRVVIRPDTTIVFCTALSQQPCLLYEERGGKAFYRPRDFDAFLAFVGLRPQSVSPVMSEQFHLIFGSRREASEAADRLAELRVGARQAMTVHLQGETVFSGCQIFDQLSADARLTASGTDRESAFFDIFYQVEGMKSGMHHPDGMLWIRAPERDHRVYPGKVALLSIAPTILDMFSLPAPSYMRAERLEGYGPATTSLRATAIVAR